MSPERGRGHCARTPDPCTICGRPLPGKGKLQDCRGAWSDAAICPASGAAANRRGPVWEFADRVQITAAYSRYGVAHWLSRSRLADRCAICGRPLPGKGKLQDCLGAWSDAAICPASDAAANRRGTVLEFADPVQ